MLAYSHIWHFLYANKAHVPICGTHSDQRVKQWHLKKKKEQFNLTSILKSQKRKENQTNLAF